MQLNMKEVYEHNFLKDFELDRLARENVPQLLRRMWGYLNIGRSLIKYPVGVAKLVNRKSVTPPVFEDAYVVMDGISDMWNTGLIGYDMGIVKILDQDNNEYDPPPYTYISLTGIVKFDSPPAAGSNFSIDTYTDGYFTVPDNFDYIDEFIGLLRIAMLVAYDERFATSSLDRLQKPSDRTITVSSEANWLKENIAKAQDDRAWLDSECIKLGQLMTLS